MVKNTRKYKGGKSPAKKIHTLGDKLTLEWMTAADIDRLAAKEKKHKVTLSQESPEKGKIYTGNLVVKSASSAPEAELELRTEGGMKIIAVYFDMDGAKYEQEIVQPLEKESVPAKFALIDDEIEMSFVMSKHRPLIGPSTFNPSVDERVNPYSISYKADVYVDENGMRPFVWYLNMMKLKIPIYLVNPDVPATLPEEKSKEPYNWGSSSGALGGINKASAYQRIFAANKKIQNNLKAAAEKAAADKAVAAEKAAADKAAANAEAVATKAREIAWRNLNRKRAEESLRNNEATYINEVPFVQPAPRPPPGPHRLAQMREAAARNAAVKEAATIMAKTQKAKAKTLRQKTNKFRTLARTESRKNKKTPY